MTKNLESRTYYLDLKDIETRSRIDSAKPGKPVQVRVRCEEIPSDKPLVAKGTLSLDFTEFIVIVTTPYGESSHSRVWEELTMAVKACRD